MHCGRSSLFALSDPHEKPFERRSLHCGAAVTLVVEALVDRRPRERRPGADGRFTQLALKGAGRQHPIVARAHHGLARVDRAADGLAARPRGGQGPKSIDKERARAQTTIVRGVLDASSLSRVSGGERTAEGG
jgi:hypothetical protein